MIAPLLHRPSSRSAALAAAGAGLLVPDLAEAHVKWF